MRAHTPCNNEIEAELMELLQKPFLEVSCNNYKLTF